MVIRKQETSNKHLWSGDRQCVARVGPLAVVAKARLRGAVQAGGVYLQGHCGNVDAGLGNQDQIWGKECTIQIFI